MYPLRMRIFIALVAFALVTACNPSMKSGTRRGLAGTKYPGLWLQKSDADELRATGKVTFQCANLRMTFRTHIINVRLIELSGNVFLYDPTASYSEKELLGVMNTTGKIALSEHWQQAAKVNHFKLQGRIKDDVLNLTFDEDGPGIDYVRTTEAEVRRYYAAQDECRR